MLILTISQLKVKFSLSTKTSTKFYFLWSYSALWSKKSLKLNYYFSKTVVNGIAFTADIASRVTTFFLQFMNDGVHFTGQFGYLDNAGVVLVYLPAIQTFFNSKQGKSHHKDSKNTQRALRNSKLILFYFLKVYHKRQFLSSYSFRRDSSVG